MERIVKLPKEINHIIFEYLLPFDKSELLSKLKPYSVIYEEFFELDYVLWHLQRSNNSLDLPIMHLPYIYAIKSKNAKIIEYGDEVKIIIQYAWNKHLSWKNCTKKTTLVGQGRLMYMDYWKENNLNLNINYWKNMFDFVLRNGIISKIPLIIFCNNRDQYNK